MMEALMKVNSGIFKIFSKRFDKKDDQPHV